MAMNLAQRTDMAIRIVVIVLLAAVVFGTLLVMGKNRPEPVELSPSALRPALLTFPRMDNVPGLALVERPLFWASRRPYEGSGQTVDESPQPSGPVAIDDVRLVGIIAAGAESSAVIVIFQGERRRIPFGGEIEGWELVSMTPTEAVFIGADRNGELIERTLSLADRPSSAATPPSASRASVSTSAPQTSRAPSTWAQFNQGAGAGDDNDGSVADQDDPQNNQESDGQTAQ